MNSASNKIIKILIPAVMIIVVFFLMKQGGGQKSVSDTKEPVQTAATGEASLDIPDWNVPVKFRYAYEINALVISTKNYNSSSIGDQISPMDIGIAWGNIAEYNGEIDFHWRQSGRWLYWNVNNDSDYQKAGGSDYINNHSSNNHIIPANDNIEKLVKTIKKGDHVILKGYLVEINATKSDGSTYYWVSSFSRSDTGNHACEVFYVTSVEKI